MRRLSRALRSFGKPVPTPRPAGRLKAAQRPPTARYRGILAAATLALALAACTSAPAVTPSPPPAASGDLPSSVADWPLPNHTLTPGVAGTDITAACQDGKPHVDPALEAGRPSEPVKRQVFAEYGIPWSQHSAYEVDHLDALSIAGTHDVALANSVRNLWPEKDTPPDPAAVKAVGMPPSFAHNPKDVLEWRMTDLVCSGQVPLAVAQKAETDNWIQGYETYVQPLVSSP